MLNPAVTLANFRGMAVDTAERCVQFDPMARKTVSWDIDIYLRTRSLQKRNEGISGAHRWVLEKERDPADYLDALFRDYGEKGMLTPESRRMLRHRQEHPAKSKRPGRLRNAPVLFDTAFFVDLEHELAAARSGPCADFLRTHRRETKQAGVVTMGEFAAALPFAMGENDLCIGPTVRFHDLPLVSRDRGFQRVPGLKVVTY